MYVRTLSGKLIFLNDNTESYYPDANNNYKYTGKEYYGQFKPKKQKLDKVYSPISLQKILQDKFNYQLINITGYKGNRCTGYNTYRILSEQGDKVMDGHLHEIAEWIEQQGE